MGLAAASANIIMRQWILSERFTFLHSHLQKFSFPPPKLMWVVQQEKREEYACILMASKSSMRGTCPQRQHLSYWKKDNYKFVQVQIPHTSILECKTILACGPVSHCVTNSLPLKCWNRKTLWEFEILNYFTAVCRTAASSLCNFTAVILCGGELCPFQHW